MSHVPDDLLTAVLQLPADARADLTARLLDSLEHTEEGDVESAWAEEIKRRVEDLESGKEQPIPLEEAWKIILDDSDAADAD